jgi:glutathione S-transferase
MLRFYGAPMSSAARCHWLLEELGVPYEHIVMSLTSGSTRQADFLQLNPAGTVPVLVDDGFVLVESLAINFYLADKHRLELAGDGQRERAMVMQWSLWALANLQPHLLNTLLHSALLPPEQREAGVAQSAKQKAAPLLRQLDTFVAGKSYMLGERFTLADLHVASVTVIASLVGMLDELPDAGRWMAGLARRPAFSVAFPLPAPRAA